MSGHIMRIALFGVAIFMLACFTGCSKGLEVFPTEAAFRADSEAASSGGRVLWGYYEMRLDPAIPDVSIMPLRQTAMHLNALKYLETPTVSLVGLASPPKIVGDILKVDIKITHPLPQKIYTGFDVRGILITRGSVDFTGGFTLPGQNDLRLLNADGYTRFWNPAEFTGSGYQDGKLGTPNSVGNFDATVNGYKYFADGLGALDSFETFTNPLRGAFSAGETNVRHYEIKIGGAGLLFNYAVDASWAMPDKTPPTIPDDFDVNKANSKEAWRIIAHIENRLSPGGGECDVSVDVYDWQGGSTIDSVYLACPNLCNSVKQFGFPVDHGNYVTYSLTFTNELMNVGPDFPVLIQASDTEAATNQYLESFYYLSLSVPDVIITLDDDAHYKTPGTDYNYAYRAVDVSTEQPPVDYLDFNGPWDFTSGSYPENEHRIIYSPDAPEVAEFKNQFSSDVEYFLREGGGDSSAYRAEAHKEPAGGLYLYGIYSKEMFDGSLVFNTPAVFQYPLNTVSDMTINKKITVVPFVLIVEIEFHLKAVGCGWAKVPIGGGTWYNCLLMRESVDIETSGVAGQGWVATLLLYEWVADDGTVVAMVLSSNAKDQPQNFNPDTFVVTGGANFSGLAEITHF